MQSDPILQGAPTYLHARATRPASYLGGLSIRIDNYTHIRRAYGAPVAQAAIAHLRARFAESLRDGLVLIDQQDGSLTAYVRPGPGQKPLSRAWASDYLKKICSIVPLIGFDSEAGPVHLALSGNWEVPPPRGSAELPDQSDSIAGSFCGLPPGSNEQWACSYRADMASCAEVLGALARSAFGHDGLIGDGTGRHDLLTFAWQGVVDAAEGGSPLFFDARPVLVDWHGTKKELAGHRAALERLGLASIVDQFLVNAVFDELHENPDIVLGVTISAQSIGDTMWWLQLMRRMSLDRSSSRRLVVTMSEAAAIPDIRTAAKLIRELQGIGVKFAIDNFGVGFASIRELIALSPDIARIDPFFLQWRGQRGDSSVALRDVASVAGALASLVVIGGIAGEEQSRAALAAGLKWQQGPMWGELACVRPWRSSSGVTCQLVEQLQYEKDKREARL